MLDIETIPTKEPRVPGVHSEEKTFTPKGSYSFSSHLSFTKTYYILLFFIYNSCYI